MTPQAAYSNLKLLMIRHARREAGIQSQGWEASILPCNLDLLTRSKSSGNLCRKDKSVINQTLKYRHSREGGNPEVEATHLDSRLRGNDEADGRSGDHKERL